MAMEATGIPKRKMRGSGSCPTFLGPEFNRSCENHGGNGLVLWRKGMQAGHSL